MFDARASEGTQYWGAEGILCGVKKLKNLILSKGSEYENMSSQENFEFHSGSFVSDTCGNYSSCSYQMQLATTN